MIPVVQKAHLLSKRTYGTRRIAEEIAIHGTPCSRTKAATIIKLAAVTARQKKKFKVTTDSKHNLSVTPNLLEREFNIEEPDTAYVSDITYIWTGEG